EALADRIDAGPELARRHCRDHADPLRAVDVARLDAAPLDARHAQELGIARRHRTEIEDDLVLGREDAALWVRLLLPAVLAPVGVVDDGGGLDAGERLEPRQRALLEVDDVALLGVTRGRKAGAERERVLGVDGVAGVGETPEALGHRARA